MKYTIEELMNRVLHGSQEVANNIFQPVFANGKIQFRVPGQPGLFDSPRDAMEDNRIGLKRRDVIDPFGSGGSTSHIGPLSYPELEKIARRRRFRIVRESWDINNDSEALLISRYKDNNRGVLIPGKNDVTVLRFFDQKGTELTSEQTVNALQSAGWRWYDDAGKRLKTKDILQGTGMKPKLAKRMRSLVSLRQFASAEMPKLKVGVFDPLSNREILDATLGLGDEATEQAVDGLSIINPRVLQNLAKDLEQQARELERLAGTDNSAQAVQFRREAKALRTNAAEMKRAASKPGSRFNVRAMNLDIKDLDTRKRITDIVNGQIKGDTLVGRAVDFATGRKGKTDGKWAGLDLIVAKGGITQEFGMEGPNSFLSLEATKPKAGMARVDVQSLSSFPYLFEKGSLIRNTLEEANTLRAHVLETGQLPPTFMQGLREIAGAELPDDVMSGLDEVQKAELVMRQNEARQILEYIDAGYDVRKSPNILNMILESKEKELARTKFGRALPNFLIPDAIDAHVANSVMAGWAIGKDIDVAQGQLTFHPQIGWIMNPADFARYNRVFGGWDQDDALRVLLRVVEDNYTAAIPYRLPTTLGEITDLRILDEDPAWEFLFKQTGRGEIADELREIRKEIQDGASGLQLTDLQSRRSNLIQSSIASVREQALNRIDETSFLYRGADESAHRAIEMLPKQNIKALMEFMSGVKLEDTMTWWDQVETIKQTKYQLEQYANAKNVMDSIIEDSKLERYLSDGVLGAIENEEVIDAIVNPGSAGRNLMADNKQIRERIGYALAEAVTNARAAGEDIASMGVDRELFMARMGSHIDDVMIGISSYNESAGVEVALDDVMTAGYYTNLLEARGLNGESGLLGIMAHDRKEAVARFSYGDEVLHAVLGEDEERALQNVFNAFQNASDDIASFIPREISEILVDNFGTTSMLSADAERTTEISRHVAAAVAGTFDDAGNASETTYKMIAGLMQVAQQGNGAAAKKAQAILRTKYMDQLAAETIMWFEDTPITSQKAVSSLISSSVSMDTYGPIISGVTPDYTPTTTLEEAEEFKRILNMDAIMATLSGKRQTTEKLTRINMSAIRSLMDDVPGLKGGIAALGTVIAGSFLYEGFKGSDRTPEDLQGPPLLPGGSPYEARVHERMAQLNDEVMRSAAGGTTYSVNVQGAGYDPAMLQGELESITGGAVSGNIYSGGRSAKEDIFGTIRDSF